jgi:hypothetical protein
VEDQLLVTGGGMKKNAMAINTHKEILVMRMITQAQMNDVQILCALHCFRINYSFDYLQIEMSFAKSRE